MENQLRILVSDTALRDALCEVEPTDTFRAKTEAADIGFIDSLYPLLVEWGISAVPASVAAGILATWLVDGWKRRGSPNNAVIGVEIGQQSIVIQMSDEELDRIARRICELLSESRSPTERGD